MSSDSATWTPIPNSGSHLQQVIGDGVNLYAFEGFYAPTVWEPAGNLFLWTAPYTNPMKWTLASTPGLPSPLTAGANDVDYDADHHVLYAAIQGAGMWRMKTR
jgi:hypothetical protein